MSDILKQAELQAVACTYSAWLACKLQVITTARVVANNLQTGFCLAETQRLELIA